MLRNIFCWKGFGPVTGPPSFLGANFQQMVIARLSLGLSFLGLRNFLKLCHDEKPLDLVTWWKRLGISAIKTGQDAPSWIWCTERLSFFGGGHIVLQRFVHVQCHFQPLPTKLVFAYFDRGSYIYIYIYIVHILYQKKTPGISWLWTTPCYTNYTPVWGSVSPVI